MEPAWVVEADVHGVASEAIRAEVRRQGMTAHVVKYRPGSEPPRDLLGAEALPRDARAIFLGTHPAMRHVQLHRAWRPGGWCSFERLTCSTYYAHLGPWLLNHVVELNAFSCSGLYECDLEPIVRAASTCAREA